MFEFILLAGLVAAALSQFLPEASDAAPKSRRRKASIRDIASRKTSRRARREHREDNTGSAKAEAICLQLVRKVA